jgi:NAD(P)-dependent dehydrogenase (short-subunit alcohol dehydrogenase family)
MARNGEEADSRVGRFAHKTALITGASDRGIGGAIAHRLANEGAAIALASRTEPKRLLDQLAHRKRRFQFYSCDVTHDTEVRATVAACHEQFGAIDILVNNAGIEFCRPLEQFDDLALTELLETNLLGAIRMTRAVLPRLRLPGGVIVNISSALSQAGSAGFSVYSASKAGLNGFTQSLAWELAPRGIRAVAVAPGVVLSGMTTKHLDQLTPEAAHQVRLFHPLDVGLTSDVAAAVAFLASDEARWITGIVLPLGWTPAFPLPITPEPVAQSQAAHPSVMAR